MFSLCTFLSLPWTLTTRKETQGLIAVYNGLNGVRGYHSARSRGRRDSLRAMTIRVQ